MRQGDTAGSQSKSSCAFPNKQDRVRLALNIIRVRTADGFNVKSL